MKKLRFNLVGLVLLAVAVFVLAPPAKAQVYSPQSLLTLTSLTNNTTIYPTNIVLDVRKQKTAALQISLVGVDAIDSNIVFTVRRSVDGITYDTTGTAVNVAANGTNAVVSLQSVDSLGAGYLKLYSIANPHASVGLGAITVKYGIKIGAP